MFTDACALIESTLTGEFRQHVVDQLPAGRGLGDALARLRHQLRAHTLTSGARTIDLEPIVRKYDKQTRKEGFHVLHDWDGKAGKVNPDTIPVDVLTYLIAQRGGEPADRRVLAVLLDYYLLHLLSLLTMRIWDEGDADANLDRAGTLLAALQSAD